MTTRSVARGRVARSLAVLTVGWCATSTGPAAAAPPDAAVVFTVDSTGDADDTVLDGRCETSPGGECTLRAAMREANATTSPVRIHFDIPGDGVHTIEIGSPLPHVDNGTAGVEIDGFTQPGAAPNTDPLVDDATRLIEVVGQGPDGIQGFVIEGSNNTLRGLVIRGFRIALRIDGGDDNAIVGSIVGLRADGEFHEPDDHVPTYRRIDGSPCIDVSAGAARNSIGRPGAEHRNVISGCSEKAITMYGSGTTENTVQNNLIGLDPSGTERRPSAFGIDLNFGASANLIGGAGVQEHNVISGNINTAVEISHGIDTVDNVVSGNLIGTDPSGTAASPETFAGEIGIRLEGESDCLDEPCEPNQSHQIVVGNVIVNTSRGAILVDKGATDSVIADNRIGRTLDDTIVGVGDFGIRLSSGAQRVTVGPGNSISGCLGGVQVIPFSVDPFGSTRTETAYNTITRNSITDESGLGIDLMPFSRVNRPGDADVDEMVQEGVFPPGLEGGEGTLTVTTCVGCAVEVFEAGRPPGDNGPGVRFLATAVADSTGRASFAEPRAGWPDVITATTTTTAGSTSEFARNVDPAAQEQPVIAADAASSDDSVDSRGTSITVLLVVAAAAMVLAGAVGTFGWRLRR